MKEFLKKDITLIVIFGLWGFLGLVFVVLGIIGCFKTFDYSNKINTVGTVTKIEMVEGEDYDDDPYHVVYVSYTVDGKKYESQLNGYFAGYRVGKQINIYYDKDNPNNVGTKTIDAIFLIIPLGGIISIFISVKGIQCTVFEEKTQQKLKKKGQLIYADYVETFSYSPTGIGPFEIICDWLDPTDGKYYKFKSEKIRHNPENIIEQKNITKFPVYVNVKNKKKYAVDIDILNENNL